MRRSAFTGLILACLLVLIGSSPVSAHPGSTVLTIDLHASTSIPIVVPADYGKPIDEVDIANAAGFDLQSAEPPAGWTVTRAGDTFVFRGGPITIDNEYAVFAVRGVATVKGRLLFAVTTHSPDGTVMRYTGGPGSTNAGAIVYAGVVPRQPTGGGASWVRIAGGIVIGVGVMGTVVLAVRRRRTPVSGGAARPT
jgi:hypothetical protein